MRVLFSVITPAYLKNFESTIRLLSARGHDVRIAVHRQTSAPGATEMDQVLSRQLRGVKSHRAVIPADDRWLDLALALRSSRDYLQFQRPEFHEVYRARADGLVPDWFRGVAHARAASRPGPRRRLASAVLTAERAVPRSQALRDYVAAQKPDLVVLTPYIGLRTLQPDVLAAARDLGIPTAVCVSSWDNLSSKSLMRPLPDMIAVWNETQRDEAVRLHGIDRQRVVVTGAQCFDEWFDWRASPRTRFCRRVGLDPDRPYLLWTCFSPFKGAPSEPRYVAGWLDRLRSSGHEKLADMQVLIRPHPKRGTEWERSDPADFPDAVIWPRSGEMVVDDDAKATFFDSIFHSAAVVGINTSAMIEAAIVGRPVHAPIADEFWESQEGTLHFRYLREVGGGLLHTAEDDREHFAQLAQSVRRAGQPDAAALRFVSEFVRPRGLYKPATPILVSALERAADRGPVAARPSRMLAAARPLLAPLANHERAQRLAVEERTREKQRRRAEKAQRRAERDRVA